MRYSLGLDDAKQALRPGPSLAGQVVVTAPNALGTYQLSSIIPSIAARHPRLRVELRLDDRAVNLVKEGVDLAIRAAAPPDHASLVARELAIYNRVVCAAPSFLARHGAIDSLATLAAAPGFSTVAAPPCGTSKPRKGRSRSPWTAFVHQQRGHHPGRDPRRRRVGWLPDYVVGEELRDGRLVRLLPEAKLPPIRVYGIMPKQARQTAAVRAVLDILGAGLRAQAARVSA